MTYASKQDLLRQLPGVDALLELAGTVHATHKIPQKVLKSAIRATLESLRNSTLKGDNPSLAPQDCLATAIAIATRTLKPKLVSTINATGVVLHTNLGRALLCDAALKNITTIASGYSNLEFNITTGKRGIRYSVVEALLCELTGAEAAMAVNNNAGAVLLCLDTLANAKEVIVSRGELVEIGGSFRIPDVMAKSGGILREVGTTNRTHMKDYETAITDNTGLLLKVHTSNYRIEGFTKSVSISELVALGKTKGIKVMEDLGSGSLIDFSKYGLTREPTVPDAVAAGVDIVTFSGDKLLGGPQAGIILGTRSAIEQIRSNPLTRALRIDKLTLAALESTLALYRDEALAVEKIPTLRMLALSFDKTKELATPILEQLKERLNETAIVAFADLSSRTGGGAFPELALPSRCIAVTPLTLSADQLQKRMRMATPAIIGRIDNDRFIIDPRTLQPGDAQTIINTLCVILTESCK
ncbi:SelA [Desulforapulum autotrophicum HRM2]|uniref:L-seryl-tRNA(Sec) selenium transferase n=1 Tax=Desulforapulum autotrophicum (strain ATCC 43914 / DSM 3382 / VKM B-1955 / HRM2) TaxID=177437 RepID=C0Q9T7_DESAH|nr:L-seryl-tRNA(Sec) selenium transferase [Desulforapulum autotrophicum]ACN16655.1 SelA [Desulforapulum autotrophicum HRM2]